MKICSQDYRYRRRMKIDLFASVCVILAGLTVCVNGVDRGNFKTCSQSGFCKRNRAMSTNQSPYELLTDTVSVKPTSVEAHLVNRKNGVLFKFIISALVDNTLRLQVEELNPLRPRYHPTEALAGEPEQDRLVVKSRDVNGFTATFGSSKAVVNAKPLRIDLYSGEEMVISVNARGLMRFEHTRLKPQPKEAHVDQEVGGENKVDDGAESSTTDANIQTATAAEEMVPEEDEPDMWEEQFKSHHDSKPNGPNSVGMDFSFTGFDNVYGIPEHADTFSLKTTKSTDPYRLYNLDVFEYETSNPMALYGSVPYMMAHSETRTVGVLWLNAAEAWVDIASASDQNVMLTIVDFVKGQPRASQVDTHWFFESGIVDVFFMLGPSHVDVSRQYASLVGTTQLPPIFSLGYHQSRWNYNDQDDVRQVDAKFDEHDIPYDVIWLDIEYTDGKRYFTWDKTRFPDPLEMVNNLTAKGRKMVIIVDPHIKRAPGYFVHEDAMRLGYYVKNKDGTDYDGWCWPGSSSYLDFFNPEVREYWASNYDTAKFEGTSLAVHLWNDMNEPSVFNGPEVTMPKDVKHFGGWEHREVHNMYGLTVIMATNKGLLDRSAGKHRPFLLSRAAFVGVQRYAAVWTGDNMANWDHFRALIPMCLSMSVAGITFVGADVGGFFHNPEIELLIRWYQAAAFQPFFRSHAHIDTRRREPYIFDEDTVKVIRDILRKRYTFLPYWYSLFYENEVSGMPPMRPMWYEFPMDTKTFKMEDQHMLGRGLLVHPVSHQGVSSVEVYFPGENEVWYDMDTYEKVEGHGAITVKAPMNKIPVYVRGGCIIPKKERVRRSASLGMDDPYTLVVALDKAGKSSNGTVYIDDGFSYQYKQGDFVRSIIIYDGSVLKSRLTNEGSNYKTKSWLERVIVAGYNKALSSVFVESASTGRRNVEFSLDDKRSVLVIRKPAVNMGENWTITLS